MSFMRDRRDRHASASLQTSAAGAFFKGGYTTGEPALPIAGSVVVVSPVSIRPMNRRTKSGSQTEDTYQSNRLQQQRRAEIKHGVRQSPNSGLTDRSYQFALSPTGIVTLPPDATVHGPPYVPYALSLIRKVHELPDTDTATSFDRARYVMVAVAADM
jgi:hypothetical protein